MRHIATDAKKYLLNQYFYQPKKRENSFYNCIHFQIQKVSTSNAHFYHIVS